MSEQAESQPLSSGNNGVQQADGAYVDNNTSVDLTGLFKDDEVGVFDAEKVSNLAKDFETQKKSTSYYQSQYMKKNGVPETPEGYLKSFKPDSIYEEKLKDEKGKQSVTDFFTWCHENKVGEREAALFLDHKLKDAVKHNIIDVRTPEMLAEEANREYEKELENIKPMLDNLGRTIEENNSIIDNFLNSPSIFTNNPEMKEFIKNVADYNGMGYKFVTLLTMATEHKGIPVVTGTLAGSKDKAAFERDYQKETNPIIREQLMKTFLGEN